MSFYYQHECGERFGKLNAELANSDDEAKDLALYYESESLVQCPKCGAKYKVKKLPKKIINIVFFVGFIVALVLKFALGINLVIIYGVAFIVVALMIVFDNYFEK